jgi:hypothetical protein
MTFEAIIEAIAVEALGAPNPELSQPPHMRFGNGGFVSVNYTNGEWRDSKKKRGGGFKEFIRFHTGIDFNGLDDREAALSYIEERRWHPDWNPEEESPESDPPPKSELAATHPDRQLRLVAALSYATERGWDVFPADISFDKKTGRFNKKSHKSAKHSGGANWGKTRDPKQIRNDFKRWPQANIGIPTGADNKIWVLEIDTPKGHNVDGEASLRALEAKHEPLPQTLMAESPSGSRHRYFNWPKGVVIKNSTSSIDPGIDVRGEGGMVIAPPSVRADGVYRWLNDNPIADAPQWLIDLAVAPLPLINNRAPEADRFKVAEGLDDLPREDLAEGVIPGIHIPP